ncbi:MAG: hypothetical protein ACRDHK_06675 [Actinomycetota bacterium]
MQRIVGTALIFLLSSALTPAAAETGQDEPRWVVFLSGGKNDFAGTLEAVRSNGSEAHTLLRNGVLVADVGPEDIVYAVREEGDPPVAELLRIDIGTGLSESLSAPRADTLFFSLATSTLGDIAFERFVPPAPLDPPPHLAPAVETLRGTFLFPLLVPTERPPGTTDTVAEATEDFYRLLFTNDPSGTKAHAEQMNVFVDATLDERPPPEDATPVEVRRGRQGSFFCGASTCFLQWREPGGGPTYMVGEFGSEPEAVAFTEALVPIEDILGFAWQDPEESQVPQVVVRTATGAETVLREETGFCECGYRPVDWSPDGQRVLVIFGSEGFVTRLEEYDASAAGEPAIVGQRRGEVIIDAGYGPDGILALFAGEGGPPGTLETLQGEVLVEGVRAFDVQGSLLAYVNEKREVLVRDLEAGLEQTLGDRALGVSIAPEPVAGPTPSPSSPPAPGDGIPVAIAIPAGLGALAFIALVLYLGILIGRRRQR